MYLGSNEIIGLATVVVTIIFGILGLLNKYHKNSIKDVKDSNIVQNVAQGNNNTNIINNYVDPQKDVISTKMNSLAEDYISNFNLRQLNDRKFAYLEQGFHLISELSTMVLEKEYDEEKIPKLKSAYVCLQEDMRYVQKGIPLYLNVKKKDISNIEDIAMAFKKVMGKELEYPPSSKPRPRTRVTNYFM